MLIHFTSFLHQTQEQKTDQITDFGILNKDEKLYERENGVRDRGN
jgi:hypothetical protein